MRAAFGASSCGWGRKLTEAQRQRWTVAAQTTPSHPSLGQYSHLSGQQLCTKINSTLCCIGHARVAEPPNPIAFSPNPVGGLEVVNDEDRGVRLLLTVGSAVEDIMLFGQAPCSSGRMKHRRVVYLGLLGSATNGQCDITSAYTDRFGQPGLGQKVFIVTCQTKDGWKGRDHVASAIVPPKPPLGEKQAKAQAKAAAPTATATPEAQSAPREGNSMLPCYMYKGRTPVAPGQHIGLKPVHPLSFLCIPLVHIAQLALARLGVLRTARAGT